MSTVRPSAYLFWYKSDEKAQTQYIYIIAFSVKQARLFFIKNGYTYMYDYSCTPIDEISADEWTARHEIGDILGQYAVI